MASQPIYQFYVELQDYTPKIWRRFQVFGNVTAARLGYMIMTMFEMQASHLFCIDVMYRRNFYQAMGKSFSAEEIEKLFPPDKIKETCRYEVQNQMTVDFDDEEAENAVYAKISQLVSNSGDEMVLFYDYGDGWEVSITLEKYLRIRNCRAESCRGFLRATVMGLLRTAVDQAVLINWQRHSRRKAESNTGNFVIGLDLRNWI